MAPRRRAIQQHEGHEDKLTKAYSFFPPKQDDRETRMDTK